MSEQYFDYPPSVTVLQQLVSPCLTQVGQSKSRNSNVLLKAVRSWVILESLYGSGTDFNQKEFQYPDWRNYFFYNDRKCPSQKTIQELLGQDDEDWQQWKEEIKAHYRRNTSKKPSDLPDYLQKLDELLENECPFNCTGKTIKNNLKDLNQKEFLGYSEEKQTYFKLVEIPTLETKTIEAENSFSFFMEEDDSYQTMLDKFNQPLNGIQRLFFYYDYKILDNTTHQTVSFCRDQLKEIWTQNPVPIIQIKYKSSSLGGQEKSYFIAPICIYYYQRSFYLIAFGQFPKQEERELSNWYNYRLDRIKSIQVIEKDNKDIPQDIRDKSQDDQNDLTLEIQDRIEEAYGFDFYLPSDTMLLRFPQQFNQNYISNTVRHRTFKQITHQEAIMKVKNDASLSKQQREKLTVQIKNHPNDGYYTLQYRKNENSVIMRLRAWCPNVEVLLPWDLRQRMKNDMQKTWELYKNDD